MHRNRPPDFSAADAHVKVIKRIDDHLYVRIEGQLSKASLPAVLDATCDALNTGIRRVSVIADGLHAVETSMRRYFEALLSAGIELRFINPSPFMRRLLESWDRQELIAAEHSSTDDN